MKTLIIFENTTASTNYRSPSSNTKNIAFNLPLRRRLPQSIFGLQRLSRMNLNVKFLKNSETVYRGIRHFRGMVPTNLDLRRDVIDTIVQMSILSFKSGNTSSIPNLVENVYYACYDNSFGLRGPV